MTDIELIRYFGDNQKFMSDMAAMLKSLRLEVAGLKAAIESKLSSSDNTNNITGGFTLPSGPAEPSKPVSFGCEKPFTTVSMIVERIVKEWFKKNLGSAIYSGHTYLVSIEKTLKDKLVPECIDLYNFENKENPEMLAKNKAGFYGVLSLAKSTIEKLAAESGIEIQFQTKTQEDYSDIKILDKKKKEDFISFKESVISQSEAEKNDGWLPVESIAANKKENHQWICPDPTTFCSTKTKSKVVAEIFKDIVQQTINGVGQFATSDITRKVHDVLITKSEYETSTYRGTEEMVRDMCKKLASLPEAKLELSKNNQNQLIYKLLQIK